MNEENCRLLPIKSKKEEKNFSNQNKSLILHSIFGKTSVLSRKISGV